MNPIQVVIFESNMLFREVLENLLKNNAGYNCNNSYNNCNNIIEKLQKNNPDVILLDVEMPEIDIHETIKLINGNFPLTKVLVQTVYRDDDKLFSILCSGANGYIFKSDPAEKYLKSISDVFDGGASISPSVTKKIIEYFNLQNETKNNKASEFKLSSRETEILEQMMLGYDFRTIGDLINISYETVRSHVKRIYKKLHVSSRNEAIIKARDQKIFKQNDKY